MRAEEKKREHEREREEELSRVIILNPDFITVPSALLSSFPPSCNPALCPSLSSPLSKVLFNLLYWHSESSQCAAAAEIVTLQWRLHWSASYTPAAEARRDESSSSLFCCSLALSLSPMPSCVRLPWSYRVSLSGPRQLRSLCIVRLITPDSVSQTELAITRGPAISSWCSVAVYSHFNRV